VRKNGLTSLGGGGGTAGWKHMAAWCHMITLHAWKWTFVNATDGRFFPQSKGWLCQVSRGVQDQQPRCAGQKWEPLQP